MLSLHPEYVLRKLKIAAYVERVLDAAEQRLSNQSWWSRDIEQVLDEVRRVPIDELAAVIGTWAGLKWLDAAENLRAADWLVDTYPGYARACLDELSALFLNYAPRAVDGPLVIQVPVSGALLARNNTRLIVLSGCEGTWVYWSRDLEQDTVRWSGMDGRPVVPNDVPIAQMTTPDGRDVIPIIDERAGLLTMDSDTQVQLTEYLRGLPASVFDVIREGCGLVAVSDVQPGNGDTRPALLVRPEDLATGDYREVARQLCVWLGAEFVRLYGATPARGDLAQMAVQRACTDLEASDRPSRWLWRATSNEGHAHEERLNPLRQTVHAAVASTLDGLADVLQPLSPSDRTVDLLAPFNANAAVKTKHNGLLPASWFVIDHVSGFAASRRAHVIAELSRGEMSEAEHYVMAACHYADGRFADAVDHLRECLRLDPDCMEYFYLTAFCERHLGESSMFEARVFDGVGHEPRA